MRFNEDARVSPSLYVHQLMILCPGLLIEVVSALYALVKNSFRLDQVPMQRRFEMDCFEPLESRRKERLN